MRIRRPKTAQGAIAEFKRVARAIQRGALTSEAIELRVLAYADPRRDYHGIMHPLSMLRVFYSLDTVVEKLGDRAVEVAFMILDHDVLYQPIAAHGANEVGSAAWAEGDLTPTLGHAAACRIGRGIRATATHSLVGVKRDERLAIGTLIDLDLMGLGGAPEEFDKDTERVWAELAPFVSRDRFNTGRAKWARSFLAREQIFHTKPFRHLERPARENLSRLAVVA